MNMAAQGSSQWHAARKGRITASVIGKVIMNKGRDEVLRDMVRDALGYPRAFQGNVATEYGHAHEDEARTEYAINTGNAVAETGFHQHPEHEWLGASPDGLVGDDGLVEIKAPFKLRDADEVPRELVMLDDGDLYWHQMQAQMAVMGRAWCDFAVWCPGDIKVRRYLRHPDWLGWALDTCEPFLAYLKGVLADSDKAERVADMTQDMGGNEEWQALAEIYRSFDAHIKQLKEGQNEVRDRLVELACDRRSSGAGISVSPVTRSGGVDYKAMAEAAGVDPEQYRKPASTSWQIRVSKEQDNG